jgi:hypothetical protein
VQSWHIAPSGTAGNAITFTQAMTLDADGDLGIGTTSPQSKLHIQSAVGTAETLITLQSGYSSPSGNKSIAWTDGSGRIGAIGVNYTAPQGAMTFGSLYNSGYNTTDLMTLTPGSLYTASGLYVGIGNAAPTNPITVAGTGNASYSSSKGIVLDYTGSSAGVVIPIGFSWSSSISTQNPYWGMGLITTNFSSGTGSLGFYTGGNLVGQFDLNGKFGVGTTSVPALLNVGGNLSSTYNSSGATGSFNKIGFTNVYSNASAIHSAIQATNDGVNTTGLAFLTSSTGNDGAERARIDSSGNLLIGTTNNGSSAKLVCNGALAVQTSGNGNRSMLVNLVSNENFNGAATTIYVGRDGTTSRSINAGGTVNASGADYAEYMTKAGSFTVAKGDVIGIDAQGKLTNVYADAISFVVKSTDPSYVGGDTWGVGFDDDAQGLEAARQTVDRIAFAGQVPVNVIGASAGQYIIPINDNGAIKGQAVNNPTFEQYQAAVGKVIAIEADGRARIIVKVA